MVYSFSDFGADSEKSLNPNTNGFTDSIENTRRAIEQINEKTRQVLNDNNERTKQNLAKSNDQAAKDWSKDSIKNGIKTYEDFNVGMFKDVIDVLKPAIKEVAKTVADVAATVGGSLLDSLGISSNMLIGMACFAAFIVLN
jgi:hypothetical protein